MGITSAGHGIIDEGGKVKSNQCYTMPFKRLLLLEDVGLSTEDGDAGRWSFSLKFIYIYMYTNKKRPKGGRSIHG